jgi:hypothetical protein
VSITPYLWIPAVETTFTIRDFPVEGESTTSPFSVFDELQFALMGTAEVGYGRFGLITDLLYVALGSDYSASLPNETVIRSEFDLDLGSALGVLTYRVVDEPRVKLDLAGGARFIWTTVGAELAGSGGSRFDAEATISLVDPVVGLHGGYGIDENWGLSGMANVGGFGVGTELTWEAIATIDYRFNETVALRLGYRVLSMDLAMRELELDVLLHGPVLGLAITF